MLYTMYQIKMMKARFAIARVNHDLQNGGFETAMDNLEDGALKVIYKMVYGAVKELLNDED